MLPFVPCPHALPQGLYKEDKKVPDQYESVGNLPFTVLATELGIDLSTLKQANGEWVVPCPLHGSKTNKGCFRYAEDGRYHCFSCPAK